MARPRIVTPGPLDVVRAFLEAPFGERAMRFGTGPIRRYQELDAEIAKPWRITGSHAAVRHLALGEETESHAICECDCELTLEWENADGSAGETSGAIRGPIVLTPVDGEWKVVDYVGEGDRRALDCLKLYDGVGGARSDDVRVSPLAASLAAGTTSLIFELTACGDHEVVVERVIGFRPAHGPGAGARGSVIGEPRVAKGATTRLAAQLPFALPLATSRLKVEIHVGVGGVRNRIVRLRLPIAGRGRPGRVMIRWLTRKRALLIDAVVIAAVVIFLVRPGLPFGRTHAPSRLDVVDTYLAAAEKGDPGALENVTQVRLDDTAGGLRTALQSFRLEQRIRTLQLRRARVVMDRELGAGSGLTEVSYVSRSRAGTPPCRESWLVVVRTRRDAGRWWIDEIGTIRLPSCAANR